MPFWLCLKVEIKSVAGFAVYLFRGDKRKWWGETANWLKDLHSKWGNTSRRSLWEGTVFQKPSLDVLREEGGTCSDSKCVITLRNVFCQRLIKFQRVLHLFSYCWQCTKLSGVLRKKWSHDGGEGGRRRDERIKINMQANLSVSWSVDLRKKKK